MTRRAQDVLKGLTGLVGLLVGLLGVPLLLTALGQGLPSHFAGGRSMVHQLHQPLTDSALLRGVSLLAWLIWLLFAAAVAIELLGEIRFRAGRTHLPWRVPGLQGLASSLMLTVMLLSPQRGLRPVGALPTPPPAVAQVVMTPALPATSEQPLRASAGMLRYTVQRYDSLWRIAEQHLGDGLRWHDIRDANGGQLAAGQTVSVQGDVMQRPDGRIIYPGEVLLVPAPAPPPAALAVTEPVTPTESAPAPTESGPAPTVPALPTVPPLLSSPPATAPPLSPSPLPALHDPAPSDEPPPMLVNLGAHHSVGDSVRRASMTLLEAGLLSAAVLGTLRTLRRRQAQGRPQGRRIRLPDRQVAAPELAMQAGERPDQLAVVRAGVHALVASLRQGDAKVPTILGIVVGAEGLELLVDRPAPPPSPWASAAEGFRWRIQLSDIDECGWEDSDPLPALVPIGRAAGSDAEVLLNLEAAGIVSVTGNPAKATGVVRAVAASLSGLPWAASVNVIVIGFGAELEAAEHVRAVADLNEIVDELESTADVMRAVIGGPNPLEGRVREQAGDGWPPTIVLCTTALAPDQQGKLARLAEPGTGVVAIVVGGTAVGGTAVGGTAVGGTAVAGAAGAAGNPWTIDVDTEPMAIQPLRLAVEPTILGDAEFEGIESLYQVAQDTAGSTAHDAPYDELEVSVERPVSIPVAPPVFIRVLGTVELDGVVEFRRPKSRELAVYLALHPSGVGEAQLDEAMWPSNTGRVVAASTRDSTVSVARTALGGPRRLLPAQVRGQDKRYQVSSDVGTDWAMFCDLHRRGRAERDVAVLLQALELVRGRPFDGVSSARTYGWVHTEGHARQMEAEIGDAADLAAGLLLAGGQAVEARAVARQGLLADPYLERLWVRLMEVADVLGDSQEVERIMDELDKVLELNGDFSGLHPQTLVAYQRFSRRHRVRT